MGPPNGRSGSAGSDGAPAVRPRTAGVKEDFGRASKDYARHRAGFPARFYTELAHRRLLEPGRWAVDLGTGTGTIARELARRGLEVTAMDVSPQQIEVARRTSDLPVDWRVGPAEDTGLPDATYDLVVAGQCWHWFRRDAAVAECRRILRPGGALVIAHFDWLPLPGTLARATEDLILQFNPGWTMAGGDGLHPGWFTDVAAFADLESFTFDHDQPYTHVDWRGRIRASAGVGASLPADEVEAFDEALAALLLERFADEPLHVRHRVFGLIGHHEGGAPPEASRAKPRGCG